jgi:hypothetical protein
VVGHPGSPQTSAARAIAASFAHRAADAEVRRTRSVVSAWSAPSDPFGSYSSSFVAHCFTR